MKNKITESVIKRVTKRLLKEDLYGHPLYDQLKDVLSGTLSSKEEKIYILKEIIKELETSDKQRNWINRNWNK